MAKYYDETQQRFCDAEVKGRELFINYLREKGIKQINYGTQTQEWDIWFYNKLKCKCYIELKYRWKYNSTDKVIKNEGILFEEKKFDNLKHYQITNCEYDNNSKYYYVSLFADGVGYSHQINIDDKDSYKWVDKKLPYSTVAKWGDKQKKITYIPLEDCKQFTYTINTNADTK